MRRIVVLGRGGAGKSTFAVRLGAASGLPVTELDQHFWTTGLVPMSKEQWAKVQRRLVSGERWILDGDLGPYDVLSVRLRAADTVIVLDFSFWRCAWRALRRSRENLVFWRWLVTYRQCGLPVVMAAIADHAGHAELHVIRDPRAARRLVTDVTTGPLD